MMAGKRTDVIVCGNVRAGWQFDLWSDLHRFCLENGIKAYPLEEQGDFDAIVQRHGQEIKLLCVYGGDGTLLHILQSLIARRGENNLPIIVAIRGGTMNRASHYTGWMSDPMHNARTAIELFDRQALSTAPEHPLRLLKVQWGEREKKCYYAVTFFAGAPVRILECYSRFRTTPGTAALFGAGAMASARLGWPKSVVDLYQQIKAGVVVDGRKLPHEQYLAIAKDSLDQLSFNIRPYKGVCADHQSFSFAYAIDYREAAKFHRFFPICFGFAPDDDRYFNQPTREMMVTPKERITITLDGDLFPVDAGEVITISQGPVVPLGRNPFLEIPLLTKYFRRTLTQARRLKEAWTFFVPIKK